MFIIGFLFYFHLREMRSWCEGLWKGHQSQRAAPSTPSCRRAGPASAPFPTFTTSKGHFHIAPVRILISNILGCHQQGKHLWLPISAGGWKVKLVVVGKCHADMWWPSPKVYNIFDTTFYNIFYTIYHNIFDIIYQNILDTTYEF